MPRKIQPSYTAFNSRLLAAMGDSFTYNTALGVLASEFHPAVMQTALRALGARVRARNLGISGNTTGQMVARIAGLTLFEVPTVAVFYGGTNDAAKDTTVASGASSTVFTVQAGKGADFIAGSYVLVNLVSRKILSVATDTITLATALGGTPSAGQVVSIDTQANLQALVAASVAAGCTRNVIVAQHYLNWSAGGDTTGTPLAANATLRVLQQAAATASGAIYCDAYTYFRALIVAGTETQGSFSWHVLDSNTHLNALGELYLARCVTATIQAQSGWVAALS